MKLQFGREALTKLNEFQWLFPQGLFGSQQRHQEARSAAFPFQSWAVAGCGRKASAALVAQGSGSL